METSGQPGQPGPQQDSTSPAPVPSSTEQPAPAAPAEPPQKEVDQQKGNDDDEDEDSDFDELDDVLDDFSKPKAQPAQPAPAPAPADTTGVAPPDFDEDAFLKQLEKDMANMMGNAGPGGGPGTAEQPDFQNAVNQGADVFAKQLEESGIPPGDFLKQLLADVMAEEGGAGEGSGAKPSAAAAPAVAPTNASAGGEQPAESFNDAIQRTMERMKESGNKATEAASTDDGSDDMLAQLLKAVEAGAAGAGEDGDLTKMFMGMMEQLSNKEMLYEPMKELDGKFGPWIEKNKAEDKVPAEDMSRYETQAKVVKQIVQKFEEPGYTDEDPKCREYIWERMQEMQAAGSPPEELISNPHMADLGGLGGLGAAAGAGGAEGVPDCPQQ
ncbi:Pex19 protein [Penicillium cinerascens]|uniref:Pex19 protein n=1 Tax=Penicillium cinerascens TaxID=70096 RepID=A0A9W9N2G1_9EURO|nr:Pex19 protein [Penicillium cinerascens]KAJ5211991.1 Pex19 protein [Penicillium cinerascens]